MNHLPRWKYLYLAIILIFFLNSPLLFSSFLTAAGPPRKADAIVVLGAPASEEGTITPTVRSRMDKGIELYRQGYARRIIVSGGAVQNQYYESHVMRDYALSQGIPASAVTMEDRSVDTFTNLCHVRDILKADGLTSVLIVTSSFHTRRVSILNDRYFNMDATIISSPLPAKLPWNQRAYHYYSEFFLIFASTMADLQCP